MTNLTQATEDLAKSLAEAQRLSVDDAIRQALEARARAIGVLPNSLSAKDRSQAAVAARTAKMDAIVAEIAALPVLDDRSPREIMDDLNQL